MAGEVVTLASEAPLLQDDYSHDEPGPRRKGKRTRKMHQKRRDAGARSKSKKKGKARRSRISDAMGASY